MEPEQELLEAGCTGADLKEGGFNAQQLKDGGYGVMEIKQCVSKQSAIDILEDAKRLFSRDVG